MSIFTFSLPQEETALFIGKAHWSSYLSTLLKILATGLIVFLILTFSWPFWWSGHWGKIAIVVFVLGVFGYAIYDCWNRFLTTYIITQCRVIDITQEMFFRRVITEIDVKEAGETIVKQRSWWDRFYNKGDLIIKLSNGKGVLVFYDIVDPVRVQGILDELNKEASDIIEKRGEECDVILKDDKEHQVPLSYAYYGDKAKEKKVRGGLIVVKKKKKGAEEEEEEEIFEPDDSQESAEEGSQEQTSVEMQEPTEEAPQEPEMIEGEAEVEKKETKKS